ncbi:MULTISPECIES: hypothetical protein [Nitrospirillum]|uniref:Uncharacterized protein n=1 Tax=Nitrospirillum amazonense TaxID=28077 RepID=A0A560FTX6_9PROT|nr:hypothetical protein [Nitrospirillum amazonense]MEC4590032.1 hypothetical protein [Nitrospirillum amazonense]TWB25078.1 hypothetical protein FBZ88_111155 [Nitrospirillum amazonense]
MSEKEIPSGQIEISIRIESNPKKGGKYIWYYNGLSSSSFSIRVPPDVGYIKFTLDDATQSRFVFRSPDITQFEGYTDLAADYTDSCVTVTDNQANQNYATVGEILLNAEAVVNGVGTGQLISSDPEFTNTGGEFCPS